MGIKTEYKRNIIINMDPQNNNQDILPPQAISDLLQVGEHEEPSKKSQADCIKDNQYAVIYESQKFFKLLPIRAGDRLQTIDGAYKHNHIVGHPWAEKTSAFNKPTHSVYALKPKSTLITETLAKKTQILYSMDNSAILFKLDVKPGDVVVEAGTGSGSLSCAFSQTLGRTGRLYTFQFNKERAELTKQFFQDLQKTNVTSNWRDVCANGFHIEGEHYKADALFLDVPNPWAAITHAKATLKRHGRICCFSPCIQQVQRTCNELRKQRFKKVEAIECLSRQFEIEGSQKQLYLQGIQAPKRICSISRAVHSNRGHTGFLVFAVSC